MSGDGEAKKHVAARVEPDTAAGIDRLQSEGNRSQSEAVRELLRRGIEAERLRPERNSLQNQLNTLAGREREHGELVEYVQEERSIQERREERRDVSVWRRAKWWLLGRA